VADFGYWTVSGRNGLQGGPSTLEELPDGRPLLVKYEGNPAVLEDDYILYALSHIPQARVSFSKLFPFLDEVSQMRLANLILFNKRASALIRSDTDFYDAVQHAEVTAGVRTLIQPSLSTQPP